MSSFYMIEWNGDTSMALGVQDAIANAPVCLLSKSQPGAQLMWTVDFNKNVIFLDTSQGQLAIDFQGGAARSEVPLVLTVYNGKPTPTQRWSFFARKGYITSLADTTLVVDNKYRSPAPQNQVWGYTFNGSIAQQWHLVDVLSALAHHSAAK